ncbi:MAG: hypothetical protein ACOVN0_13815 [Niveispirillum sp.]|uniref:hypothetical protein n=1 Tax=Niveispirillum sp. TaxID=1917217 RepID=UPI003BA5B36A
MSISSITSTPPDLTRAGLEGFQGAQQAVQVAADAVANGNADPAVILDVKQAEVTAGISAAVMKADQQNFQRLLDIMA